MSRQAYRDRAPRRCSCGMLVNMGEEAHARTRSHQVAPQVARWLDDGLDTYEISKRAGMDRSMVRRIGMSTGRFETRRTSIVVGDDISPNRAGGLLNDLAHWASGHGMRVMYAHTPGGREWLSRRVFTCGHLCAVVSLCPVVLLPGKETHRLSRPRPDDYDFILARLRDGRWLVIPFAEVPMPVMSINVAWGGRFSHYVDAVHQLHDPPRRAMLTTNK